MSRDPQREARLIEKKIAGLRGRGFFPKELLDLIEEAMRLQRDASEHVHIPEISREVLAPADTTVQGAPLLVRERFIYDEDNVNTLFDELLALALRSWGPLADGANHISSALASGRLVKRDIFSAYLTADETFFAPWRHELDNAPMLLDFLAETSLVPSLAACAAKVAVHIPTEHEWNYGHCPVCGQHPLIADLRGKEGQRYLTCSFCRHEYRAKRLACVFCGEEKTEKLQYFSSKDEPGYQVHVCESCKHYLKTADFREYDRSSIPVLDDLESLTLDILARNKGYGRPTLSAWGF
ncbi:formate dehydrogenase accessory protein FdhE [Desulfovibrio inopinatus]|uniref:formate dehydrogenase accessory protein FdhE n=1 Tax=Desulfovibrio inopinatus TaxID=102109 RepID=UPI00041EF91F|nr:formate dehydrogenase accessory protein FdhE [Desulfovibrio inopinatus]